MATFSQILVGLRSFDVSLIFVGRVNSLVKPNAQIAAIVVFVSLIRDARPAGLKKEAHNAAT